MTQEEVYVPIVGYFARHSKTKEKRFVFPKLPDGYELGTLISHPFRSDVSPRTLLSLALEAMAFLRERGTERLHGFAKVVEWIVAKKFVEPVDFIHDDHVNLDFRYRLTAEGLAFLQKHEAPAEW